MHKYTQNYFPAKQNLHKIKGIFTGASWKPSVCGIALSLFLHQVAPVGAIQVTDMAVVVQARVAGLL